MSTRVARLPESLGDHPLLQPWPVPRRGGRKRAGADLSGFRDRRGERRLDRSGDRGPARGLPATEDPRDPARRTAGSPRRGIWQSPTAPANICARSMPTIASSRRSWQRPSTFSNGTRRSRSCRPGFEHSANRNGNGSRSAAICRRSSGRTQCSPPPSCGAAQSRPSAATTPRCRSRATRTGTCG